jgi:hypothetical protein
MALERLADGGGADVGIAVHVAADPRPEAQHLGQAHRRARFAEHRRQRRLHLFEERRHHQVEHVGEEEQDVLALVGHGGPLARLLLGLPRAVRWPRTRASTAAVLRRREHGVEPLHQIARDPLLLLEDGAARRLGRVGGEHRAR